MRTREELLAAGEELKPKMAETMRQLKAAQALCSQLLEQAQSLQPRIEAARAEAVRRNEELGRHLVELREVTRELAIVLGVPSPAGAADDLIEV